MSVAGMETRPSAPPILNVIDNLAGGGAQRHLLNLCRHLDRTRFGMDVFALHGKGALYADDIRKTGSRVFVGSAQPWALPVIVFRLLGVLLKRRYRLVQLYLPASILVGTVAARLAGVRRIAVANMARRDQFPGFPLSFVNYKRLEPFIDRYLTGIPGELRGLGIDERKIIYSTAASDSLSGKEKIAPEQNPLIARYGIARCFPVMITIGRLIPEKGNRYAIDAMRAVVGQFPSARLMILGEGPERDSLERRALAAGVADAVVFAGFHKDPALPISLADLFLRTAVNESTNFANLLTMAFGLPTVAFDVHEENYELVAPERNGLLVPVGDVAGLAAAICRIAADAQLRGRMGTAAKKDALKFDLPEAVRTYETVYAELLGSV